MVSLVRSNDKQKCGFLKTSNRGNVLLSRAQHGMLNKIGTNPASCCPRHKSTPIEVLVPDDFARLAPEGVVLKDDCRDYSVDIPVLTCVILHFCTMPFVALNVEEQKKGCEHECPRTFGDLCELKCQVILFGIPLPCGHIAKLLRCHEAQILEEVLCQAPME
jgi:hypothetical protein